MSIDEEREARVLKLRVANDIAPHTPLAGAIAIVNALEKSKNERPKSVAPIDTVRIETILHKQCICSRNVSAAGAIDLTSVVLHGAPLRGGEEGGVLERWNHTPPLAVVERHADPSIG